MVKDKVAQDITLNDMNNDDKDSLLNGCIQFLSETDSSGRPIVFYYGKHITPKSWKNWVSSFVGCLTRLETAGFARSGGGLVFGLFSCTSMLIYAVSPFLYLAHLFNIYLNTVFSHKCTTKNKSVPCILVFRYDCCNQR